MTEKTSPYDRFVPIEEVARNLDLSAEEVVSLIHEGLLHGVEIGSPLRWRVALDSIEEYLDDQSEAARRAALWRQSQAASFPELWGRGDVRHGD